MLKKFKELHQLLDFFSRLSYLNTDFGIRMWVEVDAITATFK